MSGITDGVVTLLPAPEGYVVDFDNPARQATTETYWVAAVGNFVALLFISQRLYVKFVLEKILFHMEDWFLIVAWLTSITVQAILLRGFASGVIGVHAWEISLEQFNYYSVLILIAPVVYAPCHGFAKLALLCFYRRLSPQTWFLWSVNATIIVVVGYTIGIFFSLIFACNPMARSWDVTITAGSCIDRPALYIATAVLGVATDVMLLVLPVPMVLGLQMPTMQKVGLLFMFTVGSLTVVTSIVRLFILLPILTDFDQTWAIAFPCTWICVEANLLVICGSLPTLRKFFYVIAPRFVGESPKDAQNDLANDINSPNQGNTIGGSAHLHLKRAAAGAAGGVANVGLRTFGSSGTRNKKNYSKFGESIEDTEFDMNTLHDSHEHIHNHNHDLDDVDRECDRNCDAGKVEVDVELGLRPDVHQHSRNARVSGKRRDRDRLGSGESEEGIVQTTTVTTVQYCVGGHHHKEFGN